ncbi:MAG: DUF1844 domain-containing protein [Pirellulales bacterium]
MPDEKKIIIDEDWKSQVQAEKEAAAKSQPASSPEQAATAEPEAGDVPMPPASFELLLTMLATEALVALGQLPHPITGKPHVQRNQATYLIDMLDVLRNKTQGNLNPGEEHLIESLLHQLRLVFVETANQPAATTAGDR